MYGRSLWHALARKPTAMLCLRSTSKTSSTSSTSATMWSKNCFWSTKSTGKECSKRMSSSRISSKASKRNGVKCKCGPSSPRLNSRKSRTVPERYLKTTGVKKTYLKALPCLILGIYSTSDRSWRTNTTFFTRKRKGNRNTSNASRRIWRLGLWDPSLWLSIIKKC